MANPQKENGHIDIANEIVEAFCRGFPGRTEAQILWAILRKTYGWHKKSDLISIGQLVEMTGKSRRMIIYALQNLEAKRMIIITRKRGRGNINEINNIAFQKNYDLWVVQEKSTAYLKSLSKRKKLYRKEKDGVVQEIMGSARNEKGVVQEMENDIQFLAPTKETITKETITKDKEKSEIDIHLVQLLIDLMLENNPKSSIVKRLTSARQAEWINQCRLLREADGWTSEQIEAVIRFSQNDSFWKGNILSMPKLREKWDQLWMKAKRGDKFTGIREFLKGDNINDK